MQHPPRPPNYYRNAPERFWLLADIEPCPGRRRYLRRAAPQHEQWAADLEVSREVGRNTLNVTV